MEIRYFRVHSFGTILTILRYSGLGITEYTEFQFRKERSFLKRNTHGGGDLRTTMSATGRRPCRNSRQVTRRLPTSDLCIFSRDFHNLLH